MLAQLQKTRMLNTHRREITTNFAENFLKKLVVQNSEMFPRILMSK